MYAVGVGITCGSKPLPSNMVCVCPVPHSYEFILQINFISSLSSLRGMRWHSWLRHCATSRKVTDSIPSGVIGTYH
jgi:hypothetical protein